MYIFSDKMSLSAGVSHHATDGKCTANTYVTETRVLNLYTSELQHQMTLLVNMSSS